MRVATVEVTGLFGLFDHRVELNQRERITIVYGPNGLGKTTLLRMLANLFDGRLLELKRTRFDSFQVTFSDGTILTAYHAPQEALNFDAEDDTDLEDVDIGALSIRLQLPGANPIDYPVTMASDPRQRVPFPISMIEREFPFLERSGPKLWTDLTSGEELSLVEVAERYEHEFPPLREIIRLQVPSPLSEFLESLEVHFIETQRLLAVQRSHGAGGLAPTVPQYSSELVEIIQEYLTRSGRISQQLDRTFPGRLLSGPSPTEEETDERGLRARYMEQSDFRARLMHTALLDMGEEVALPERQLEPHERVVLWTYLNDADEKLAVFAPLLDKLELLLEIINARFLYKVMVIDAGVGFNFQSSEGQTVPLRTLSSGEQHELVLAYQLLFKVNEGALVLIDEPEISLHVTWQQRFLEDIQNVSKVADLDFMIATHSPQIIHDRLDLAIALASPPS